MACRRRARGSVRRRLGPERTRHGRLCGDRTAHRWCRQRCPAARARPHRHRGVREQGRRRSPAIGSGTVSGPAREQRRQLRQRLRGDPSQPAELPGVVLREHARCDRQLLPRPARRAEPGDATARRGAELRRLLGGPPGCRVHGLPEWWLRAEARAVVGFHERPAQRPPTLERLARSVRAAADRGCRHPGSLQRHARLRRRDGRPLAARPPVGLPGVGAYAQQPADRHVRRIDSPRTPPIGSSPSSTVRAFAPARATSASITTRCCARSRTCTRFRRSAGRRTRLGSSTSGGRSAQALPGRRLGSAGAAVGAGIGWIARGPERQQHRERGG